MVSCYQVPNAISVRVIVKTANCIIRGIEGPLGPTIFPMIIMAKFAFIAKRIAQMPHITDMQRYKIDVLYKAGHKQFEIANIIGVHPSTICRELYRNGEKNGEYNADKAQEKAVLRYYRTPSKITPQMAEYILLKLQEDQSPDQITGRAKLEGIPIVCHETIYQYVYKETEAGNKLTHLLRHEVPRRKKRTGKNSKRGQIADRVSIEERPEIVNDRNRLGDYEIDLVIGKGHKQAVVTVVDRTSRFLFAEKVEDKSAPNVGTAIKKILGNELVRTITTDNGKEFSGHVDIASVLTGLSKEKASWFFAHPYHSWERGTNENTNGLLRQYIPKNRPFEDLTSTQLQSYVKKLNNRPRKILGYRTPSEVFEALYKEETQKISLTSR